MYAARILNYRLHTDLTHAGNGPRSASAVRAPPNHEHSAVKLRRFHRCSANSIKD
jgi:hypothetical protein